MDPHRNCDVGTIVNRQKRRDGNVALNEDIHAWRVESLLRLHAQPPSLPMRSIVALLQA
ncbi:MAG TPA: hypothetical protein VJY34_03395 [Roseiarcus sp.]|nr:hypothetical protein [Roseiarcus sp.]